MQRANAPPDLVAEEMTVRIAGREVLSGLSLRFHSGKVTGILGPNGAGKTTLLKGLAGVLPLTEGQVLVGGESLDSLDARARARRVAWLPQASAEHWPLSVWDTVALGRIPHRQPWSLLAEMTGSAADHQAILQALEQTDTLALKDRRVDHLSGGERGRVLLARALAVEAPVLLADEPVAHLDPGQQLRILSVLRRRADCGETVVMVMHDLSLALHHCDRVVVLHHGRVVGDGSPDAVLSDSLLRDVYGIRMDGQGGRFQIARLDC